MKYAALLITILLIPCVAALTPSEIHYNPAGDDNGKEFIELVGTEDLAGCVARDSASADTLELLQEQGVSDLILIVETDGVYATMETEAAVYGAGAAIGNGLGNTADTITITCSDGELLSIAYNTSSLPDVPDGASIVYDGVSWIAGTVGGTPGIVETVTPPPEPPAPAPPKPKPAGGGGGGIPMPEACNTTLLITLGATQGHQGDIVTFTILSDDYASWEALTDELLFAFGDTLTSRTHAIELPATEVRLIAESRACGGRQRATRYITVVAEEPVIVAQEARTEVATPPPAPQVAIAAPVQARQPPAIITGAVVLDEDADAIPWISSFAIITVLASVTVFLVLHRRENTARPDAKHIRTPAARDPDGSERQDGEGTAQEGMVASDRDVRSGRQT